jgi:hypothetical protein
MAQVTVAQPSPAAGFGGPLEPVERISEALFGLIMVLTFTCSVSVATAGSEIRTMLFGALGCNLVWGIIDAVLYLMASLAERGHGIDTLRSVRRAADPKHAQRIIANALPPVVASVLGTEDLERLRQQLNRLPEPPPRPHLGKADWLGALGVFLWVFVITFPLAIPFVLIHEPLRALRFSNGIAIVLLFLMGHAFGRASGLRPWSTGLVMVVLGVALVAATIALGG